MKNNDFGEYKNKLGPSAIDVFTFAMDEASKRKQDHLGADHLFLALLRKEKDFFEELLTHHGLKPEKTLTEITNRLDFAQKENGLVRKILRFASMNSFSRGANKIESYDLLLPVFTESKTIRDAFLDKGLDQTIIEDRISEYIQSKSPRQNGAGLSKDEKRTIKEAVQGDNFDEAYRILSDHYKRVYMTGTLIFRILVGTIVILLASFLWCFLFR